MDILELTGSYIMYLLTHVRQILTLINQTLEISSPYEIVLIFLPNLDFPPDLHTLNRQNIIIIAFYTLYISELKLIRLFQQQKLDHNAHLQQWPRKGNRASLLRLSNFIFNLLHFFQMSFIDEANTLIIKVNQ